MGQVTLFPVYLAAFFVYMGLLEGRSLQHSCERLSASFPATYATGTVFWPLANVLNFRYVPATRRVLYVNAMVSRGGRLVIAPPAHQALRMLASPVTAALHPL